MKLSMLDYMEREWTAGWQETAMSQITKAKFNRPGL